MQTFDTFDGGILVDKPAGPTSHDVVDEIRRQFRFKKVGHCGTLDPGATGLLIVVLGKATKLSEKLMGSDKVYSGELKLGEVTSTYDSEGELLVQNPVPPLTLQQLNSEATAFRGDQLQTPPMVSAVKVNGVPLYKLARKGLDVERKPRLIYVYKFLITAYEPPFARFEVACTKGTYVRSLVHDFGNRIGCGAHLTQLRRHSSGNFDVKHALPYEEILCMPLSELEKHTIPFLKLAV